MGPPSKDFLFFNLIVKILLFTLVIPNYHSSNYDIWVKTVIIMVICCKIFFFFFTNKKVCVYHCKCKHLAPSTEELFVIFEALMLVLNHFSVKVFLTFSDTLCVCVCI